MTVTTIKLREAKEGHKFFWNVLGAEDQGIGKP